MPRGACVVQVYVCQEDLLHVFVGDAVLLQAGCEPVEAGSRACLDEGGGSSVLGQQKERGYDLLPVHEIEVYGYYLHLRPFARSLQPEIIQTLFVRLPARLRKERTILDLNLMRELSVKTDT